MAEETQPKSEEVAVEKATVTETPPPAAEEIEPKKAAEEPEKPAEEATEEKKGGAEEELPQAVSFKEESNVVADLQDPEKKSLDEFKQLIMAALSNNEFKPPPPPPPPPKEAEEPKKEEALAVAEIKTEEPAAAPTAEEPPKKEEEEPPKKEREEKEPSKPEPEAPKEESSEAPPPQVAEEKAVVIEDDGTKTVEAIEETVVPVSAPPPPTTTEEVTPAEPPAAESAAEVVETPPPPPPEEVFLWGIPLVGDEKSDTILLKFLRARDFKVKEALSMMKNTVIWRKAFGIEALLEEDVSLPEMNKVVFMHGQDKEGHPVCYNVYGEFQDKDLYAKAFGDEEKRGKFLRWRIQFLEKGIRQLLDFSPGGVCTMVQVNDLKNSPGPWKRELRQTTNQALALLQDNYPEFVAKQIFINVPWWYLAYNRMISPFLTQRTKSKFVFAGPSKSAETVFKYIAPEQVPVRYGGLSKENDPDFTTTDAVTEITIKPSSKQCIEITVGEACLLVWELRVLGWDVTYGAEFVPSTEGGYTVIVQKARKLIATDDPVEKNSFKIGDPGKIVLTIDNATSKKKKLLYRYKAKSSTE